MAPFSQCLCSLCGAHHLQCEKVGRPDAGRVAWRPGLRLAHRGIIPCLTWQVCPLSSLSLSRGSSRLVPAWCSFWCSSGAVWRRGVEGAATSDLEVHSPHCPPTTHRHRRKRWEADRWDWTRSIHSRTTQKARRWHSSTRAKQEQEVRNKQTSYLHPPRTPQSSHIDQHPARDTA